MKTTKLLTLFFTLLPLLYTACSKTTGADSDNIDTPPTAVFTVFPASGDTNTWFVVNASATRDEEDQAGELRFRWDWQNDGIWDRPYSPARIDSIRFNTPGSQTIALQVYDSRGHEVITTRQVLVRDMRPMGMRQLTGGIFTMGDNSGQTDARPAHQVTLTSFWMDTVEVTRQLYQNIMHCDPSAYTSSPQLPVQHLSWYDALLFCNARSKKELYDTIYTYTAVNGTPGNGCSGLPGLTAHFNRHGYRLPTEAEWEYACRAGSTTKYSYGDDSLSLNNYAWFKRNSTIGPHAVAQKPANAFGLFDMHGNVAEWCHDFISTAVVNPPAYYQTCFNAGVVGNPLGPVGGADHVERGGAWGNPAEFLQSAYRMSMPAATLGYNLGFRCVFQ
jgi:formylglycine-generating enzyme required for sulfatase activity